MENNKITRITKLLLDIMFFVGIIVTVTIPFSFKFYGKYNDYFEKFYLQLVIIFFISGIFAILILRELRKMFSTVLRNDCFVEGNVTSLKRMSIYSFAIVAVTLFRLFVYFTPSVSIIVIVFLIAGLFSRVLAIVFDKAVSYKQENDFTI
ncbi:MAG: DUF2975 domain-containing protein [Clostridium sp.]|nr:DUF2975 domain-containing protein [Clostridium sp.]MCM1399451.1 DUF2975 domain-containing protein [Clostridium sp.]MCM1460005.1 DUF2975 domain-containing protein [Bacteroides sp.]